MKKIIILILFLLFLIISVFTTFVFIHYEKDIPVGELVQPYSLPSSKFVHIQGMSTHFSVEGEGHPFLLIHGTGASIHDFNKWAEIMKPHYQIIRLDLPGFGLTGPNPSGIYDTDFYLNFLEEFLDYLKVDSIFLAGNSFGGHLAWNYSLKRPDQVKKLVLLNAAGYPRDDKKLPLGFRLTKNKFYGNILGKITPKFLIKKTVLAAYADDDFVQQDVIDRYFELLLREGNRAALVGRMTQAVEDYSGQIPSIKTPTLILWGKEDEMISASFANKFDTDIPNSRMIIYDDIGHLPMEEHAKTSASDTHKFLQSTQ